MKYLKKYLIPILIIVLAIGIYTALKNSKPKASQKNVQELEWLVNAVTAQPGTHSPVIKLYGQLISSSEIEISVNIEAPVAQRHIEIGSKVSKDQILFSLDPFTQLQQVEQRQAEVNEFQAQLDDEKLKHESNLLLLKKEKALLELAEASVERARTLEKREMASSSQLDDAKRTALAQEIAISQRQQLIDTHSVRLDQLNSRLKQAQTRLALAKKDYDETTIRSPVNGLVQQIKIDQGELVRKGNVLVTLLDTDKLEMRTLVPEKHVAVLQQSLNASSKPTTALVSSNQIASKLILNRVANFVEKGLAGNFAYFKLDKPNDSLTIGQTYELHLFLTPVNNSILLPHEALYGIDHIFVINNDRLQSQAINWIGESVDQNGENKILITSSQLKQGDLILASKFANAIDGLKVKVNE